MSGFLFNTTASLLCQPGAVDSLPVHIRKLGGLHCLLVTDPGLISTGLIQPVADALQADNLEVTLYDGVQADPPESLVLSAAEKAKQAGIDCVVGLGGGSSMDVAKLIAALVISDQPLADMYGIDNIKGSRLPLIQVPTTAGTGSEVTPISIITTGDTTKTGVVSPKLLPDLAILDAKLTTRLPAHITAATGIDAMVHAIEAYTSKHKKNPYSDMLAKEALTLLAKNLLTAVKDGSNLPARSNMLLGATLAGQAFANAPVAAVHALAYPLGGHFHIPHGLSNSLVLPHVLHFNASTAYPLYAELLPYINPRAVTGFPKKDCEIFIESLICLIDQTGLQKTLREMDIPESDLAMLADDAMLQQRLLVNNPREVSRDDVLAIYRAAY